jgi:hypothetical protein
LHDVAGVLGFSFLPHVFQHDEGLSYSLITGDPTWIGTANNYPLNTRLMTWSKRWLGAEEWSLRFPNLVAHVLYLVFGLLLLRHLQHAWLMLVGFALLNLNPFVMDFFSVARGYGLALGLSMGALYFLLRGWTQTELWPTSLAFLLSLTLVSFADLANFAWVNVHIPLLAATLLVLWTRYRIVRFQLRREVTTFLATIKVNGVPLAMTAFLAGVNAWFLYNLSRRILSLQTRGELYAGGQRGFIADTLGSLVDSYYYTRVAPDAMKLYVTAFGIAALLTAIVLLVHTAWKKRQLSFSAILLTMVTLAILLPVAEHHIFGSLYPMDRAALGYIPLWSLLAVFFADENISFRKPVVAIPAVAAAVLLVGFMTLHFLRSTDSLQTYIWPYDAETKTVMIDVGKHYGDMVKNRPISIGNFWAFEPSINYYRLLFHYDWLTRAIREDPVAIGDHDIIYCYPQQLEGMEGRYTILKTYPKTGTVLVHVNSQEE